MPHEALQFFAATRTREDLDADYSPSRFVASLDTVLAAWASRTAQVKAAHGERLKANLAYGPHPRELIDFYSCGPTKAPTLVFIHGGFWSALSKDESGFIADRWTQRGVHVVVMNYALAPEATLSVIVGQVRRGLAWLHAHAATFGVDRARLVLAGHSAGAHLAAMTQLTRDDGSAMSVAGLVLVSGVFELEPVRRSYVNDAIRMSEQDVELFSPARLAPSGRGRVLFAVGEHEPRAFQVQSRFCCERWRDHGCAAEFMLAARRNHFDILDDLSDPDSALGREALHLLS